MTQKDFTVGLTYGLAIGMTFGLVVGMLFAPANGAEARRRLRYEQEQAVGVAREKVRRTMARLQPAKPEKEAGEAVEQEEEDFFGA